MRRFLEASKRQLGMSLLTFLIALPFQVSVAQAEDCPPTEFWYCDPRFVDDCFCTPKEEKEEPVEKLVLISTEERRLQKLQDDRASCEADNGVFHCDDFSAEDCSCQIAEKEVETAKSNTETEKTENKDNIVATNKTEEEKGDLADDTLSRRNQTAADERTIPKPAEASDCSKYSEKFTILDGHIKDCMESRSETATWCEAGNIPSINGALTSIQQLARTVTLGGAMTNPAAGSANGIMTSCGTIGKISRTALGGLSAYRAACAPKKMFCQNTCDDAVKYYEELNKEIKDENVACHDGQFKDIYMKNHDPKYTKSKKKQKKSIFYARKKCGGYKKDLLMAAVDAGAIYASMKQAEKCDQQVADVAPHFCQEFPDSPVCASTQGAMDCQSNPNSAFCICQTNPQDPLCLSVAGAATNPRNSTLPGGSSINAIGSLGDVGSNDDSGSSEIGNIKGGILSATPPSAVPAARPSESKVNVAPTGSTAKIGGVSGNRGSSSSASRGRRGSPRASSATLSSSGFARTRRGAYPFKSGTVAKKTNPYRVRGRLPAKSNGKMIDLRKFLPGGELDPRRKRVAASNRKDGITGPMGPSLFDKISRRYDIVESELYQEKVSYSYRIPNRRRRN